MGILKDIARRLKITYKVYNLLHKKKLKHNPPLYRKYGLQKRYYSTISSKDFTSLESREFKMNVSKLKETSTFQNLANETQTSIEEFGDKGYTILRGFFSKEKVDGINSEIGELLAAGKVSLRYANRKVMFSHHTAQTVNELGNDPRLKELLNGILDGPPVLYQSINFPFHGSEQRAHSDSIHLTTYPRAGMVGVWIALEPIDENNGPISYFPGSHKLPYAMNDAYDNEGNQFLIGDKDYIAYEDMIEEKMKGTSYEEKLFLAEPGDVLIWHANLIHGGRSHIDKDRTRKSLVLHYFNNNSIWYHELSQRPALTE